MNVVQRFRPKLPAVRYYGPVAFPRDPQDFLVYLYSSGITHYYRLAHKGYPESLIRITESGRVHSVYYGPDYINPPLINPSTFTVKGYSPKELIPALRYRETYIICPFDNWNAALERRGYLKDGHRYTLATTLCDRRVEDSDYELVPTGFPVKEGTGVHISTEDKNLLAYYPDFRHIKEQRAVKIRPGRYLKKYFPSMSDDEIRMHSALIFGDCKLVFYSTFEAMYNTYMSLKKDGIVTSCMAHEPKEYDLCDGDFDRHPLQVYHNSDVQLAALLNAYGKPIARALVDTKTKEYPIIYGQWEKMEPILEQAGYTHGDLSGAKINKILRADEGDHAYVMPYIDACRNHSREVYRHAYVIDCGDYFEITEDDAGIPCSDTCGYIKSVNLATCSYCGGEELEEGMHTIGANDDILVCEHCYMHRTYEVTTRHGSFIDIDYLADDYIGSEDRNYIFYNEDAARYHGYEQCCESGEWHPRDELVTYPDDRYVHPDNWDHDNDVNEDNISRIPGWQITYPLELRTGGAAYFEGTVRIEGI